MSARSRRLLVRGRSALMIVLVYSVSSRSSTWSWGPVVAEGSWMSAASWVLGGMCRCWIGEECWYSSNLEGRAVAFV